MKRAAIVVLTVLSVIAAVLVAPGAASAAATVCSVYCDTRDPSLAARTPSRSPTGSRTAGGSRCTCPTPTRWPGAASTTAAPATRSGWTAPGTAARSWDGLLGRAAIPGTWTGTRTLMYNLADPSGHRRGMIRACGDAAGVQCTDWVHPQACDIVCDGADASTAVGDSQPVGPATLSGRTIALHMDTRGMAWATIAGGAAGDEIWLDRSWDEGATWPGGSSLGRVSTPGGATRHADGHVRLPGRQGAALRRALRACGRAVTGSNGSCTAWARPADNRAAAAADALMWAYQPDTAWWLSSWWNSAVAVTTLMDWMKRTGRTDYLWVGRPHVHRQPGRLPGRA